MVCIIKNGSVREYETAQVPYTAHLLFRLTNYTASLKNLDRYSDPERIEIVLKEELGCLEDVAKRVFGALAYPTLIVVALVESVCRILFCALALLPSLLDGGVEAIAQTAWNAMQFIIDAPVRSFSGIVQNVILGRRKNFEELALCPPPQEERWEIDL